MTKPVYMKSLPAIARLFYCIGLTGIGIQQFIYPDFRPVILPPGWPAWLHASPVWAYATGAAIIMAALLMLIGKNAKPAALLLGGFLFFVFIICQCYFTLFVQPNSPRHLGLWTNPLKELALAGGAFVMAGLVQQDNRRNKILILLEKLIPYGRIFFGIMLIAFGLAHFYYTDFVDTLVPSWVPAHTFWTYFGGAALIGGGLSMVIKIRIRLVAFLLATMLFLWFIVLHIPRAIADPNGNAGNEITECFPGIGF